MGFEQLSSTLRSFSLGNYFLYFPLISFSGKMHLPSLWSPHYREDYVGRVGHTLLAPLYPCGCHLMLHPYVGSLVTCWSPRAAALKIPKVIKQLFLNFGCALESPGSWIFGYHHYRLWSSRSGRALESLYFKNPCVHKVPPAVHRDENRRCIGCFLPVFAVVVCKGKEFLLESLGKLVINLSTGHTRTRGVECIKEAVMMILMDYTSI